MKIALGIEYHGAAFHGWQAQKNLTATVQTQLELALSKIANAPIKVICAGRTDAGVHGLMQIVHFETEANRPLHAWTIGTNTYLPDTVRVRFAEPVAEDFHARFSAIARRYVYLIHNDINPIAIFAKQMTWQRKSLAVNKMQQAAQALLGEHDFAAFQGAGCQAKSSVRTVHALNIKQQDNTIIIDIKANAFLLHMVRNIVGTLMPIGLGERPTSWLAAVLDSCDRQQAGETASAAGLYLYNITYPDQYQIINDLQAQHNAFFLRHLL